MVQYLVSSYHYSKEAECTRPSRSKMTRRALDVQKMFPIITVLKIVKNWWDEKPLTSNSAECQNTST